MSLWLLLSVGCGYPFVRWYCYYCWVILLLLFSIYIAWDREWRINKKPYWLQKREEKISRRRQERYILREVVEIYPVGCKEVQIFFFVISEFYFSLWRTTLFNHYNHRVIFPLLPWVDLTNCFSDKLLIVSDEGVNRLTTALTFG